ncbi:MAG: segregation/condensation protein A [Solobacterium sp.]|nr:segregation/condensation protein A [Solobacterium sp.]
MEEFKVTIDQFDGPLDLMLHLIREKQLDLMDLDMNILTDQYIAFLNSMETMHLEVAGEYLAEMASLIEYKSKRLLPGSDKDDLEGGEEEDTRERLVRRLLEYQQFKEASSELMHMYESRQKLMSRPLSNETEKWMKQEDDFHYKGSPYELMKAMRRCMMRIQLSRPIETRFTAREISMEDRELEVRAKLDRLSKVFRFEALVEDCEDTQMFIATFLAVLDLARLHTLVFTIDDNDVIWFSRGEA